MQIDKDLVAAAATPLVLGILAEGESYGYAILKRVRDLSEGELQWTDGMKRASRDLGYGDDWRAALAEHKQQWATVSRALGDIWRGVDLMPSIAG